MNYWAIGIVFTASLLSTGNVMAADFSFGIGADVRSGSKIYLPMHIGGFIVEPSFSSNKPNRKRTRNTSTSTNITESNRKFRQIGVGLFKDDTISETAHVYYGAKVGYFKSEDNYIVVESNSVNNYSSTDTISGYFIAPTIGAQYYATRRFSLGIDIAIEYNKSDGTGSEIRPSGSVSPEYLQTESSNYRTVVAIIARYQFFQ
ncbi:MAG: hypothetical protein ACC707_13570 [Thiohalomonadales bacterium]